MNKKQNERAMTMNANDKQQYLMEMIQGDLKVIDRDIEVAFQRISEMALNMSHDPSWKAEYITQKSAELIKLTEKRKGIADKLKSIEWLFEAK